MAQPIYDRSLFAKYFESDDPELLAWVDNVVQKLIDKGIVANYIKREDEGSNPNDYEDLFRPIVLFFGYLVRLAREFRDFKNNDFLSNQYLLNKGQYTCGDETLDQLLFCITNLLRIRGERGSIRMIEKSLSSDLDGELLRLLCWDDKTFFKLGVEQSKYNSWNINNCSPLNRSCTGRYDLNVGYEDTEDVVNISNYPIVNDAFVSVGLYRGKRSLHIEGVPFGNVAGVGDNESDKRIVIDPNINFEVTFFVAQDITLENITFAITAFDIDGNIIHLQDAVTGTDRDFFFETRRLNKVGEFYFVRGIIYGKDTANVTEADGGRLNIGFGHNLRFNENVVSIIPYIIMDNNPADDSDSESEMFADSETDPGASESTSEESFSDSIYDGDSSIYLWNLKVTPCDTYYNRCYLNNKNFIDVFVKNQNGAYTEEQINEILRKYFIPYNTAFKVTYLGDNGITII